MHYFNHFQAALLCYLNFLIIEMVSFEGDKVRVSADQGFGPQKSTSWLSFACLIWYFESFFNILG
jgi:hypothetical protein